MDRDRVRAAVGRRERHGITATGLNLTAGPPAYEIAVDPSVIALGSFEHVTPNPFGPTRRSTPATPAARSSAGTSTSTTGRAAAPRTPGASVTCRSPRARPRGREPARRDHPNPPTTPTTPASTDQLRGALHRAVAAHRRPAGDDPAGRARGRPGGRARRGQARDRRRQRDHRQALHVGRRARPATHRARGGYDCSGATSFVLHAAGIFGDYAEDSTELESYGQPGPGKWITVYANTATRSSTSPGSCWTPPGTRPCSRPPPDSGPRWQPASIIAAQYAGDIADGHGGFIQRHPRGL